MNNFHFFSSTCLLVLTLSLFCNSTANAQTSQENAGLTAFRHQQQFSDVEGKCNVDFIFWRKVGKAPDVLIVITETSSGRHHIHSGYRKIYTDKQGNKIDEIHWKNGNVTKFDSNWKRIKYVGAAEADAHQIQRRVELRHDPQYQHEIRMARLKAMNDIWRDMGQVVID